MRIIPGVVSAAASGPSGGSLDPATEALIARYGTAPPGALLSAIDAGILKLKTDGVWEKLYALQVYGLHTEQAGTLNWKASHSTATPVGSYSFTPYSGIQVTDAGGYVASGIFPDSPYTKDACSLGLYLTSPRTSGGTLYIGAQGGAGQLSRINQSGSGVGQTLQCLISGSGGTSASVTTGAAPTGFMHAQRVSSSRLEIYWQDSSGSSDASNSTNMNTGELFVLTNNSTGSPGTSVIGARVGAAWAGAPLDSGERASLREVIESVLASG